MIRSATAIAFAALGMLALLHGTPARATLLKIWVSNAGADNNTCGDSSTPCRTFFQAVTNVTAGGEIGVLTPGDYGFLEITKAVSITNDGTGEASIFAPPGASQAGILIAAGNGDIVSLRGLIIDGLAGAQYGIFIQRASAVHVQNCVVRNFEAQNGWGIVNASKSSTVLFVSDTLIYNNGSNPGTGGVQIQSFGVRANAVLDRVHLENNVIGLSVDGRAVGPSRALIRDSVVSGNATDGILAITGNAPAFIVVEHTTTLYNAGVGIHADGPGGTILLNDNTVTLNGTGISATNSGQLISYGNNRNNNNIGPEGAPTGFYSQM